MSSVTATMMLSALLPPARQVFEFELQAALQSLGSCVQTSHPWGKLGHKCQKAHGTLPEPGAEYTSVSRRVCVCTGIMDGRYGVERDAYSAHSTDKLGWVSL